MGGAAAAARQMHSLTRSKSGQAAELLPLTSLYLGHCWKVLAAVEKGLPAQLILPPVLLEKSLYTFPEACVLVDSKSNHIGKQDKLPEIISIALWVYQLLIVRSVYFILCASVLPAWMCTSYESQRGCWIYFPGIGITHGCEPPVGH